MRPEKWSNEEKGKPRPRYEGVEATQQGWLGGSLLCRAHGRELTRILAANPAAWLQLPHNADDVRLLFIVPSFQAHSILLGLVPRNLFVQSTWARVWKSFAGDAAAALPTEHKSVGTCHAGQVKEETNAAAAAHAIKREVGSILLDSGDNAPAWLIYCSCSLFSLAACWYRGSDRTCPDMMRYMPELPLPDGSITALLGQACYAAPTDNALVRVLDARQQTLTKHTLSVNTQSIEVGVIGMSKRHSTTLTCTWQT